jgi:hypothetical protein
MSILTILIGVVLAIVILWAMNTYLPPSHSPDSKHRGDRYALGSAAVRLRLIRSHHATDRSAPVRSLYQNFLIFQISRLPPLR